MKRELMEAYVIAEDFKLAEDARKHCDPASDYEECRLQVDADVDPAERRTHDYPGCPAVAHLASSETDAGVDISELLNKPAIERLENEYLDWYAEREQSRYEYAIEARYEERMEDIRERRRNG